MLQIMLLTIGTMALLMGIMAVGVLFQNKPLKGSCGGQGTDCACAAAGEKPGSCAQPSMKLAPEAERIVRDYVPPRQIISLDKL